MGASIRQYWDSVKDSPKKRSLTDEHASFARAVSLDIPAYRCKMVTTANGHIEVSVTPADSTNVINARMGFNPLLDCPRFTRDELMQAQVDIENRARAGKRARQRLRYLVKSIGADHMLTFTYRENVKDRDKLASDWKEFNRLMKCRYPKWSYISVPERHDSEETEEGRRGAFHIHAAVSGKQDIKWILRCWLLAIGQPADDVSDWLIHGVKLGARSLGAVNVEAPSRRWGGGAKKWKAGKLAGYLTKYIGKEFEDSDKNAKKYWTSRNIMQPVVSRFWLRSKDFLGAIREAYDLVIYRGVDDSSIWADQLAGVIWIQGETDRKRLGQCVSAEPDNDLIYSV